MSDFNACYMAQHMLIVMESAESFTQQKNNQLPDVSEV